MSEEQIWDILDGNAPPEVQQKHALMLVTDADYRAHFATFSSLHNQLGYLELDAPSMRFEQNLMERLQPSLVVQHKKDRTLAIFGAIMAALGGFMMLIFSQSGATSAQPALPILEVLNTEGVISWLSNPVFFYGFILLNLVLFFAVLDKKVFRPYFDKRMK